MPGSDGGTNVCGHSRAGSRDRDVVAGVPGGSAAARVVVCGAGGGGEGADSAGTGDVVFVRAAEGDDAVRDLRGVYVDGGGESPGLSLGVSAARSVGEGDE